MKKETFRTRCSLGRGHTIIEFWAEDKFGKVRVKHREVVLNNATSHLRRKSFNNSFFMYGVR